MAESWLLRSTRLPSRSTTYCLLRRDSLDSLSHSEVYLRLGRFGARRRICKEELSVPIPTVLTRRYSGRMGISETVPAAMPSATLLEDRTTV